MMYFTLDVETTVLFKAWKIETVAGLIASCIAVFAIAFLFEGLKSLRYKLEEVLSPEEDIKDANTDVKTESTETTPILDGDNRGSHLFSFAHVVQTIFHVIQLAIAYSLMLIVMTYNGWLAISVLLGAGLGYFLFGGVSKLEPAERSKVH